MREGTKGMMLDEHLELIANELIDLTCDQLQDVAKILYKKDPVVANMLLAELDLLVGG